MIIDLLHNIGKILTKSRNHLYEYIIPKTLLARFASIIIIPTLVAQFVIIQIFYHKHWYHVSSYSSRIITREINSLLDNINKLAYKNMISKQTQSESVHSAPVRTGSLNKSHRQEPEDKATSVIQTEKNSNPLTIQNASDIMPDEVVIPLNQEEGFPIYSQKRYLSLTYELTKMTELPEFADDDVQELDTFKSQIEDSTGNKTSIRLINDDKIIEIFIELFTQNSDKNIIALRKANPDNVKILRITLPAKALISPSTFVFIMWFCCLGLSLLFISLIFTKNQIKSILELTRAAERYGIGQNIEHYKPSGAAEIRRAGIAFLRMKDRIEKHNIKRTQMLAMISHDLKTPLTRMKLQVALMSDRQEAKELEYDILTMENMIRSYLDFARGEGGEEFKTVNIKRWLPEYLKNNWQNALGDKLLYEYNVADHDLERYDISIYAQIKPYAFSRALTNIIENALKYSSKAILSVSSNKEHIIISLEDNGAGIADSEKPNVFKPFYRSDKSRGLDAGASVGLGLAITQEIIQGHYGSVLLSDSEALGGIKIEIKVPAYEN